MPTWAVAVVYAGCVAGAVLLAPLPVDLRLLAFTFVVWLGGVTFTALWRAYDAPFREPS